jgi:hypothetical protein
MNFPSRNSAHGESGQDASHIQNVECPGFFVPGPLIVETQIGDIGVPMSVGRVLYGGWFNFLHGFGSEAVSPVIGDCLIDDCSTVDTFPGIKDQEEVREPFHHH